ncbi:unnamed protein product [marine sediment metagenome]|uniref:Uncharacterized protein n=1 Tax=marine sediment metagenome TaxID=412755 RepID=X1CY79_9ZZZZ
MPLRYIGVYLATKLRIAGNVVLVAIPKIKIDRKIKLVPLVIIKAAAVTP